VTSPYVVADIPDEEIPLEIDPGPEEEVEVEEV
jgi:hypothetical protein